MTVLLVDVRALDAIHVATAEILAAEADGEVLEFWTHDDRQATAALSRGLTVRGIWRGRSTPAPMTRTARGRFGESRPERR